MLIDLAEEQKKLRAELRDYLRNCLDARQRAQIANDPFGEHYMEHCKRLGADGMLGAAWPEEYGGPGFGPMEPQIFANEIPPAEVPYPIITLNNVAPTHPPYRTHPPKTVLLPKILKGQCHFPIRHNQPG